MAHERRQDGAPLDARERALAWLAGAAQGCANFAGEWIATATDDLRAMLAAMGYPAGAQARDSLKRLARLRRAALAPLICARAEEPTRISARGATGDHADWRLTREDGAKIEGRSEITRDGRGRAAFVLPAQSMGYHALEACGARATLISAPARCWTPPGLDDARLWGVSAQVYALRDAQSLAIGGYREIGALAQAAGARGASFLGLSPLHALFSADRRKRSPYSPSNRMMLETLFIDPRAAPCAPELSYEAATQAQALRAAPLVDHEAAWALTRPLLAQAWRDFAAQGESEPFRAFRAQGGRALDDHALFEALCETMRAQGRLSRNAWPADLQDPRSPACAQARAQLSDEIGFHVFLQWLANAQLAQAAQAAKASGMEIGLYRDLAVGADRAGSETWRKPEDYLLNASIGAPPDALAPEGQDWGLPPFDPVRLEQTGLKPFRKLLAANMRCAGALRIDHAFQLERLYLMPQGADARMGVYIASPFAAMLACLRVESQRARCMAFAEDLGTAPAGFSYAIMEAGLLSYRLILFERDSEGGFTPPRDYPAQALAAFSTHDLPTLAGWRRGIDIAARACFDGGAPDDNPRRSEVAALDAALAREGLSPAQDDDAAFRDGILRFLARTPARLCVAQTEDLCGEWSQPNLPGPERGHPNWRRRLALGLEAMTRDGGPLARAGACMALEKRGARPAQSQLAAAPPRATYRLQLSAAFTFDDAARIAPYLAELGVSHVYLSPMMRAARGSAHGYDATDPAQISPALGGEAAFRRLCATLRAHGLRILLDVAPNHVSAALETDDGESWWRSLLEWGRASPLADAFDVDWMRSGADGRLLLPVLDVSLAEALERDEFALAFDAARGAFGAQRRGVCFPLNPLDCAFVIERALGAGPTPERNLLRARSLLDEATQAQGPARYERGEAAKALLAQDTGAGITIARALQTFNASEERPARMARLIAAQAYRLAHWRLGDTQLNRRRFFDVNDLAGLRIENERVFARVHETIFALAEEGLIDGLRIDHVDGLADPGLYLERLQARLGPGFYVVVEKILGRGEDLPLWPVAGTTGYETLARLDALFIAAENAAAFDDAHAAVTPDERPFAARLHAIKCETLKTAFRPETHALARATQTAAGARDLDAARVAQVWSAIIAALPVYRTYLRDGPPTPGDARTLEAALNAARADWPGPELDFITQVLTTPAPDAAMRDLRRRFEQLSGPVMAKSFEDTLFYRDARFVALNEVGGAPDVFGLSIADFHAHAHTRACRQPHGLIATQTHDAKRGEDVRARLSALSHTPETWRALWAAAPAPDCPDANDRSLLLQTFLGAWPTDEESGDPLCADEALTERFCAYATKALRESKRRSDWRAPNLAYEDATRRWIEDLCASEAFLGELGLRLPALACAGWRIALARTALKLTLPGAPDIYQGCEVGFFALVDPDNRRPVDYGAQMRLLREGGRGFSSAKIALTRSLLADRAHAPALYAYGDYEPLPAPEGWLGFRRNHGEAALLVAASLSPFSPTPAPAWALPDEDWRNLPGEIAFPSAIGGGARPAAIVLRTRRA